MNMLTIALIYIAICALMAAETSKRGWDFGDNFIAALLLSPLVLTPKFFRK